EASEEAPARGAGRRAGMFEVKLTAGWRICSSLGRAGLPRPSTDTIDAGTVGAPGNKKPPPPVGDERCPARGTTPLRRALAGGGLSPCRCIDTVGSVTGTASVAAY